VIPHADAAPAAAGRSALLDAVAPVLELVRWPNALIAAGGVVLGAAWAGVVTPAAWMAALAAVGLTALANASNDLSDREIDRVAHPARPLPRGALTSARARAVAGGAALVALVASAAVSRALSAASVAVVVVMIAYSVRLKRLGVVGNVIVALLASLPFVYGAWSVGRPAHALPLFALAVPLHFAREVAKDIDDREGDAPLRRTLPLVAGVGVARATVVIAVILFAVAAALFFARRSPLAIALLGAALVLAGAGARRSVVGTGGGPTLLKGAMLLAIAAAATDVALRAR